MKRLTITSVAVALAFFAVLAGSIFAQTDVETSVEADEVPTSADALFSYLQSGDYTSFKSESQVHPSQGPHGSVRTYVNPVLEQSLASFSGSHPVGAAAVKELYNEGELTGWAVYVKTQAESGGGNGFYWYEVFSTTDAGSPAADGMGVQPCTACHQAGQDFTLTQYPLQ